MSTLLETLKSDLKTALKGGDRPRVSTIRFIISQTQYAQIEKGADLTDEEVLRVMAKQARSRRESIESFEKGGRDDLVRKEEAELAILEAYLPDQMEESEIAGVLARLVAAEGLSGPQDMGRLMRAAMAELQGGAEGSVVSRLAREALDREQV